jgi:hypothetical protein
VCPGSQWRHPAPRPRASQRHCRQRRRQRRRTTCTTSTCTDACLSERQNARGISNDRHALRALQLRSSMLAAPDKRLAARVDRCVSLPSHAAPGRAGALQSDLPDRDNSVSLSHRQEIAEPNRIASPTLQLSSCALADLRRLNVSLNLNLATSTIAILQSLHCTLVSCATPY